MYVSETGIQDLTLRCFSLQLNKQEFEDVDDEVRVQFEGFRPGMYVRVEIASLPCEFVTNFDPHYPIILGGLGASEGNVGYLQVHQLEHVCFLTFS